MKKHWRIAAMLLSLVVVSQQIGTSLVLADELNTDESIVKNLEEENNDEDDEKIIVEEVATTDITEPSENETSDEIITEEEANSSEDIDESNDIEELVLDEEEQEESEEELSEDDPTDTDGDGLTDYYENKFGTDKNKADTDEDGLSDYHEIVVIGSEIIDSLMADSDGDGILDADEDIDGDGLSNIEEINLGTDPKLADTDQDGLSDYEEVKQYGSNPLVVDTDKDGAFDRWEVLNGYNPVSFDELFNVTVFSEDKACKLSFSAVGEVAQNVSLVKVDTAFDKDDLIEYSDVYKVESAGDFFAGRDARITFTGKAVLAKNEPVIFSYNLENETDKLTALRTSITGNSANAAISGKGMYVLRSKKEMLEHDKDNQDAVEDETVKPEKNPVDTIGKAPDDGDIKIDMCPAGEADSNNDGISDAFTKLLCDGTILTGAYQKVFGDKSYKDIQSSDDADCDTFKNGDEIDLYKKADGTIYAVLNSSPVLLDTDGDGINDYDDTDRWNRGLADGVIGSIRIIGRHTPGALFAEGHSYIVFTSYVDDQDISIDNLYSYYTFNNSFKEQVLRDEEVLSWRTTVSQITEDNAGERKAAADLLYPQQETGNTVHLNRGECVSIGNYTMTSYAQGTKDAILNGEPGALMELEAIKILYAKLTGEEVDLEYVMAHYGKLVAQLTFDSYIMDKDVLNGTTLGGVWMNREMYNQKFQYSQCPNQIYEHPVTQKQLDDMITFWGENSYYNVFSHNCSSVAAGAWNLAFGYERDLDGNLISGRDGKYIRTQYYIDPQADGVLKVFDLPEVVCNQILRMAANGVPGYVGGDLPIVRGADVTNTYNYAVNHFEVKDEVIVDKDDNAGAGSKPPVKEPDKKPVKKPAKESSTSDNISSDASITVAVNSPAVVVDEPKQAPTNRAYSRKPATTKVDATVEEEQDEAQEPEENNIAEETKEISEAATPLAREASESVTEKEAFPIWKVIIIIVAAFGIAAGLIAKFMIKEEN